MQKRIFTCLAIIGVWYVTGCSSPRLATYPGAGVRELGVCVSYGPQVPAEIRQHIEVELTKFIETYNAEPHRYWLQSCADPDVNSLRLHIQHTDLVAPGENAAGILVSAVGLTLPFVMVAAEMPFYLFFYYFPKSSSFVQASLSPDIGQDGMDRIERVCTSPGFLLKPEKQYDKHGVAFQKFVLKLLSEMDKEERKAARKMAVK